MKQTLATLALLAWSSCGGWAAPSLTLLPGPDLLGAPGATAGWGFRIDNDTSNWLVVSSVTASGFSIAVGVFTEYIAQFNFYVVNPNSNLQIGFDQATLAGFGEFSFAPGASGSTAGSFDILYDLYLNDPNVDPTQVLPGNELGRIAASVTAADTAIPEPGTLWLCALALAVRVAVRLPACTARRCAGPAR